MGLFDWIPSVEEVFDFIDCRIAGHDWLYAEDRSYRQCKNCEKVEKLR